MKKMFMGTCAVAVTPFLEDGSFDIRGAKENIDFLIESGIHGICILGATGEYMSMTNEEHKAYVAEMVPYINKRVKTLVGATRETPEQVIDLVNNAKKAGADAAMVLPSPYCHPTPQEIVSHYQYIAEKTGFPLMAYNNPGSAGVEITRDTFRQLFEIEQIALLKESTGEINRLIESQTDAPEHISALWGSDYFAFESFIAGADGWVCMLANVAPRDCAELFEAVRIRGDYQKGYEIYKKLRPMLEFMESFPKPVQTLKYLLNKKGLTGGFVRRPRLELTEEEQNIVDMRMNIAEMK